VGLTPVNRQASDDFWVIGNFASGIESDTVGEVKQPSAYAGNGSCKAISDERNGSWNSANAATAAAPMTSPAVSKVPET